MCKSKLDQENSRRMQKRKERLDKWLIRIIVTILFLASFTFIGLYVQSDIELTNARYSNQLLQLTNQELAAEKQRWESAYQDLQLLLEPPAPTIIGQISDTELRDFLVEKVEVGGEEARVYLLDYRYQLISLEDLEEFIARDTTDTIPYSFPDFFDCEDFAIRLWGMASSSPTWASIVFGICINDGHAFNLFVTRENGELILYRIEAQSDEIEKIDQLLLNGIIIF